MPNRPKRSLTELANIMTPASAEAIAQAIEESRAEQTALRRRQLRL